MTKRGPSIPVKITQKTDTFKSLVEKLKDVGVGIFIVWVHEGEVVKFAPVERPEVLERSLQPRNPPVPHEN